MAKKRANKRGKGRPRELESPKRRKQLLNTLRIGHGIKEACALNGFSYPTLRTECLSDPGFETQVKEAAIAGKIVAKATAKGTLLRAIGTQWRAAVTYLERMYPEEWSRHRHVTHDGEVEVTHSADMAALRRELLNNDEFTNLHRSEAVTADGDAGTVRPPDESRQVEDGAAPRPGGPEAG